MSPSFFIIGGGFKILRNIFIFMEICERILVHF